MRNRSFTPLLVTLLIACSAPTTRSGNDRYDSRLLTGAELQHPAATNAYDLIRIKRPQFFRFRGPNASDARVIYIDGMRADHVLDLKLVPINVIQEIRLLSAPEATFRYGLDHTAGAIVVTTRVGPNGTCASCRW